MNMQLWCTIRNERKALIIAQLVADGLDKVFWMYREHQRLWITDVIPEYGRVKGFFPRENYV